MNGSKAEGKRGGFPKWARALCVLAVILIILAAVFFIYTSDYYRAGISALEALESGNGVQVKPDGDSWFFDGPGEDAALIFYPGAKVEFTAYAPLMRELAENGLDCFLVKMPFNMAIFGKDKAEGFMDGYDYAHWYTGGHSLGGAMAASFASGKLERLDGLVLLASYPVDSLDGEGFSVISIYGSEDGVLNMDKLASGRELMPENYIELCIEGGSHALFGDYGEQSGDGKALISGEEQLDQTVRAVIAFIS